MQNVIGQSQKTEGATLRGHLRIARADHWVKNVFVLPGVVVALSVDPGRLATLGVLDAFIGLTALCLITSSNYVLNELLDAPFDLIHPTKSRRPVPSGQVSTPLAYVQWLVLLASGTLLSLRFSTAFTASLAALWVMGCMYNIPPLRTKDIPYLDVLTEAINNPLRFLAGWYMTGITAFPPASLLMSYWMVGCYFMAIKRFAEYRHIGSPGRSASYRKSFHYYTEQRLLVATMFYGAHAMLFFGAFIMRYRLELLLSFPLVALVMAVYLAMGFKADSAAQRPEALYREPALMAAVASCAVAMGVLLFVDVDVLHRIFVPTIPTIENPKAGWVSWLLEQFARR